MGLTNFILTVAGVSAAVLLLRSDVKQSAAIFRRNVKHIRSWLEEESAAASRLLWLRKRIQNVFIHGHEERNSGRPHVIPIDTSEHVKDGPQGLISRLHRRLRCIRGLTSVQPPSTYVVDVVLRVIYRAPWRIRYITVEARSRSTSSQLRNGALQLLIKCNFSLSGAILKCD
ncbi:hypothetical protein MLD38_013106 [Melastoma candidum]|uniref:Uncharacterized protein n=1 Tax=Melastoma candidum TaxID=119954 RepID=A0ACB9R8M5_9MYRT|nr:hypothetical protein MLD38_013106 [Melastoma candidum]